MKYQYIYQKINFWLPHFVKILGLLAAINSLIDIFFVNGVEGVILIASSDPILLWLMLMFLVDPRGIFLDDVINFEVKADSSWLNWITFVVFDLVRSYLGFGSWSFKLLRFFGNFMVFSKSSFYWSPSSISFFISSIFGWKRIYFASGRFFWLCVIKVLINVESSFE